MPYLHERKIYLNRMKMNTKYFYTTVKTDKHCVERCRAEDEHRLLKSTMQAEENLEEADPATHDTLIACLNLVESKFYLYRENGLLVNR